MMSEFYDACINEFDKFMALQGMPIGTTRSENSNYIFKFLRSLCNLEPKGFPDLRGNVVRLDITPDKHYDGLAAVTRVKDFLYFFSPNDIPGVLRAVKLVPEYMDVVRPDGNLIRDGFQAKKESYVLLRAGLIDFDLSHDIYQPNGSDESNTVRIPEKFSHEKDGSLLHYIVTQEPWNNYSSELGTFEEGVNVHTVSMVVAEANIIISSQGSSLEDPDKLEEILGNV
jgi:hypothetical protein